jgi:hypothetical protein
MRQIPLRSLIIAPAILILAACRDETSPLQPTAPADPSTAGPAPALAAARNSWTVKASMPTPRGLHTAGVAKDAAGRQILYVFGGTDGEEDGFSTVETYDPATDTWTTQPFAQMVVNGVVNFNGVGRIGNKWYSLEVTTKPAGGWGTSTSRRSKCTIRLATPGRGKPTCHGEVAVGSRA